MSATTLLLCALFWAPVAGVLFTYGVRAAVARRRWPEAGPGPRPGPRAVVVGAVVREVALAGATALAWPLGVVPSRLVASPGIGAAVLVVPGAAMTWPACLPLALWLRRRVDNPVHVVSGSVLLRPPPRVAGRLAATIRALARSSGGAVHVIALGEGGLAALRARRDDPDLPLERLVTVATPFRAPRMGVFLPGAMARYEEAPAALAPDHAVRSEGDNVVMSDESTPPPDTPTTTLWALGHLSTWYSPACWDPALEALGLGRASAAPEGQDR